MKKIKEAFTSKNIGSGYLYFYIHFITELVCFYILAKLVGSFVYLWLINLTYDAFAFVPQALFGYISDKYSKINMSIIGSILLVIAVITFEIYGGAIPIIILTIGNALIHVNGAEVTLRSSNGKLAHSAIFVSGGSFGLITGKLLGKASFPYILVAILALTIIPFAILAEYYRKNANDKENKCLNFNYHSPRVKPGIIILLAVFIIIVRGYMGYGIPTSWRKDVYQTIALYFFMGFGKAFGGILSDIIGLRKTAFISIFLSIPFLIIGDNHMYVSLIGVFMFSMTMAITLGILVSVLKSKPGLAFGLTTIGLFLGTLPVFFIKITSKLANSIMIATLSIVCLFIINKITRKEVKKNA